MDFTVITFGDFGLMVQAFNGIAALTNHSSFVFIPTMGILIGLLYMTSRYITTFRMDLHHLITGVLLFYVMFVPKATVLLESPTTGSVVPVANVPIGLAAPLAITSQMGVYFTEQFETVFSVPSEASLLENGYSDALTILLKVRDFDIKATDANSSAASALNQDVERSVQDYLTDCVMYNIYSVAPTITWAQIKQNTDPNIWNILKTDYVNIDTTLYLDGAPVFESCSKAWDDINTKVFTSTAKVDSIGQSLMAMLGSAKTSAMTYDERLDVALGAIGISAGNSQRYMINSLMINMLSNSDSIYSSKASDLGATIMKTQATNQNNTRWAAEESQFVRYSKPIISFIELFVIAATPIMAFVIVAFGQSGFMLAFKYIMMIVWVSMWAPTLALSNFFIHYKIVDFIQNYALQHATVNDSILNLGSLPLLWTQLQDWVAVGGMMAAATPALTLMLIYGSSVTATNLASKMNQGQSVDEKTLAPDIQKSAPIVNNQPAFDGTNTTGYNGAGSSMFNSQVDMKQASSSSAKYSQSLMESANNTLGTQYGSGASTSTMSSLGNDFSNYLDNSKNTNDTRAKREMMQTIENDLVGMGATQESAKATAKQAVASFGLGLPIAPVSAGLKFDKSHSDQERAAKMDQAATQMTDTLTSSQEHSQAASTIRNAGQRFAQSNSNRMDVANRKGKEMSNAFAQLQSGSKLASLTNSQDFQAQLGSSGPMSLFAKKMEDAGSPILQDLVSQSDSLRKSDPAYDSFYNKNLNNLSPLVKGTPTLAKNTAALRSMALYQNNPEANAAVVKGFASFVGFNPQAPSSSYDQNSKEHGLQSPSQQVAEQTSGNSSLATSVSNAVKPAENLKAPATPAQVAGSKATRPSEVQKGRDGIAEMGVTPQQFVSPSGSDSSESQPSSSGEVIPSKTTGGSSNPAKRANGSKSSGPSQPRGSGSSSNGAKYSTEHGYQTFVDGKANIMAPSGSAEAIVADIKEQNPFNSNGVRPELAKNEFAGKFTKARQEKNKAMHDKGGERGVLPGYSGNATPAKRLIKDGVDQDQEFHDSAEAMAPGVGGFIYDNVSLGIGVGSVGRNLAKRGAKAIVKDVASSAGKKSVSKIVTGGTKAGAASGVAANMMGVREDVANYANDGNTSNESPALAPNNHLMVPNEKPLADTRPSFMKDANNSTVNNIINKVKTDYNPLK